jgi:hypothetical protein
MPAVVVTHRSATRVQRLAGRAALGLACLVALALALSSCSPADTGGGPSSPAGGAESAIRLDGVEVREYEGERLDSVDDFRENSIKGIQRVDRESYRMKVTGLVGTPLEFTYSEVASGFPAYEKVVQLDCVEGWSAKVLWRGLLVRDLVDAAAPQPAATHVIFRAVDGYSTSLPLDYLRERDILLAYGMNGVTLPAERGFPFELVAEDKWGYKWILTRFARRLSVKR